VSRESSLAEVYYRVPIRRVRIGRYYYNFIEVNDDCMPEVLVWLFKGPLTCAIAPAR